MILLEVTAHETISEHLRNLMDEQLASIRSVALACANIEDRADDEERVDTWRRQIRRYLRGDLEPTEPTIEILAEALNADAAAFPPRKGRPSARSLDDRLRGVASAVDDVAETVHLLLDRIARLELDVEALRKRQQSR